MFFKKNLIILIILSLSIYSTTFSSEAESLQKETDFLEKLIRQKQNELVQLEQARAQGHNVENDIKQVKRQINIQN